MIAMIINIIIVMLTMILIIFAIPTHLWARSMHADICGPNGFARMGACCAHIRSCVQLLRFRRSSAVLGPAVLQSSVLRSCSPSVPRSCSPSVLRSSVLQSLGPAAMADREVAWRALEALFGSEVRRPGSRPYKFNVVRVCGLSDRLTGSWGSQRICRLQRHFFGSRSVRHSGSFFQGPLPEF